MRTRIREIKKFLLVKLWELLSYLTAREMDTLDIHDFYTWLTLFRMHDEGFPTDKDGFLVRRHRLKLRKLLNPLLRALCFEDRQVIFPGNLYAFYVVLLNLVESIEEQCKMVEWLRTTDFPLNPCHHEADEVCSICLQRTIRTVDSMRKELQEAIDRIGLKPT